MTFVVITQVRCPRENLAEIQAVGRQMLPLARAAAGHVSVALHVNSERPETMMYWEWQSESDHQVLLQTKEWLDLMGQHAELFGHDGVEFSMTRFQRVE